MHRGALSLLYYVVNFPNSYSTEDLALKNFFRLLYCFSLDSSKNFDSVLRILQSVNEDENFTFCAFQDNVVRICNSNMRKNLFSILQTS